MISESGIFNMALPPGFDLRANKQYHSWQSFSTMPILVGNHRRLARDIGFRLWYNIHFQEADDQTKD
jgi:hypothetical protein